MTKKMKIDPQTLLDHLREGVLVVSHGRIEIANKPFARLSGFAQTRLAGQTVAGLIRIENQGLKNSLDPSQPPTGGFSGEAVLLCADGGEKPIGVDITEPLGTEKFTVLWLVRDLSRSRKLEKELQKAKQLESIAALSGGIAHDYNNLLTAIMGNISLAQSYIDDNHPIHRLLRESLEASVLAKELTQKLITFSRGGAPQKRLVAISPLVRSAAEFSLSGSNALCEFDFVQGLWTAEIDATQIGQAIHNLIMNATEAMPDGGTIRVSAVNFQGRPPGTNQLPAGKYIQIKVADQGCGIDPQHLEKVFDPYFSTSPQGTDKGKGLGLSICHSIVSKHHGHIHITSRVGKGTEVAVFLPATDKPAPTATKDRDAVPMTVAPENCRVLMMDDEVRIRELAGEMLTRLGYEVAFAANGEEALALYAQALKQGQRYDVVILDLTVRGGMGGKQTMEKLLQLDPTVKAIVSSGYSADPVMAEYARFGFSGVVAKPYRFQEMNATLAQVLAHTKSS